MLFYDFCMISMILNYCWMIFKDCSFLFLIIRWPKLRWSWGLEPDGSYVKPIDFPTSMFYNNNYRRKMPRPNIRDA